MDVRTMDWKTYKKKGTTEMRPYILGEELPTTVSISEDDRKKGSPKLGDMIAREPTNHDNQWLLGEEYFRKNYEEAK